MYVLSIIFYCLMDFVLQYIPLLNLSGKLFFFFDTVLYIIGHLLLQNSLSAPVHAVAMYAK